MKKIKNKLRRFFRDKDFKVLVENFFSLTTFQFLTFFLPLITLPYLIKVIGIEKYGVIILANSLILYFNTFAEFSFGISATREIAVHRHNKNSLNLIYSKVILTQGFILFFSFFLFISIVYIVPKFRTESLVYIFTFLNLIGKVLTPDWFFQGVERMKYITLFNVFTRVVFVVCIFIFIKEEADYYLHPLFIGLGSIFGGLISQIIIYKKFRIRLKFVGVSRIKKTLVGNTGLFVNQLLPQLYNNSTTFILGILTNNLIVGLYGSIKQIVDFLVSLIRVISRVFFPFLVRKPLYFKKFAHWFVIGSILIIIPFVIGGSFVLEFFNITGVYDQLIFTILLIGVPFLTMYHAYGTNYFLALKMDRIVIRNTFFSSAVGLLCSFPLIQYFGALGAAFNLTLCRGIMGLGLYLLFLKSEKNKNNKNVY